MPLIVIRGPPELARVGARLLAPIPRAAADAVRPREHASIVSLQHGFQAKKPSSYYHTCTSKVNRRRRCGPCVIRRSNHFKAKTSKARGGAGSATLAISQMRVTESCESALG